MLALIVDNTKNLEQRKIYLIKELKRSGIYLTNDEVKTLCKYEDELDAIEKGEERLGKLVRFSK